MRYQVVENHIEIYFDSVPGEKIRETLKICGWHWFGKKKCWSNTNNSENLIWVKKLSEELNPKEPNSLLSLERTTIGMEDLIVRSNSFYCNHHHTVKDMAGEVEVIDSIGRIVSYLIPIAYCETCNVYFLLEEVYKDLKKKGIIRCEILSYQEYRHGEKTEQGTLNSVSPLRKWGYTVSQNVGYTQIQRQSILEDIIDCQIMTKDEVLSYLKFFIKLNHNGSDMALAKWKEDHDYVANYKLGSSKRIKVNKIIVHTYKYD